MRPTADIDVSILIVSYNTAELTQAAIASIAAETHAVSYEVITVDNASSDGSAQMLAKHAVGPQTIALKKNVGFARGNNLAARQARGRYILLLNPDTLILDGAIDKLVAFAEANPGAGVWGGRTLFGDGRLNPSSCWGRMTLWNQFCRATGLTGIFATSNFFNSEAIPGFRRDHVRDVDIVSGCFMLVDGALWRRLRGFDVTFFMYGEEADLCLRARRLGARPIITPEATIVHHGGASEAVRADKMVRLLSAKASLIKRHWHPMLRGAGLALLVAWPATRALATTVYAAVRGGPDRRANAQTWQQIFVRRAEWRHGYRNAGIDDDPPGSVMREAA